MAPRSMSRAQAGMLRNAAGTPTSSIPLRHSRKAT
jgi:hypothetical protein